MQTTGAIAAAAAARGHEGAALAGFSQAFDAQVRQRHPGGVQAVFEDAAGDVAQQTALGHRAVRQHGRHVGAAQVALVVVVRAGRDGVVESGDRLVERCL